MLQKSEIDKTDRSRIADAVQSGRAFPIVDRRHIAELRRFARRTEDVVIRLAEELWSERQYRGTTINAIMDWAGPVLRKHYGLQDDELIPWRSECLVRAALEAGLLVRSTETPRAASNADFNPSYNMGPMVDIAGPLVSEFLEQQRRRLACP